VNRRRRLVIIAAAVLASFAGSTVAASATGTNGANENRQGDWWCVYVETVTFGVCQGNPLPERLPLPEDRPRL